MSRTRWIFLGIIVFAVVIVAASILLSQQTNEPGGAALTVERPDALKIRVLTALPVEPWVRSAAEAFNAGDYDVEGVPRSQSVADALTALQPTSNGAVAFTTLRNVYQEAVNSFRPNQVNSVLIVAGRSHTDQSLDSAGLIDTINRQKDPARPVRINVIDFGNDSDQQTWQALAQQTGGAYQNLAASNSPELAGAITRFVS